MAEKVTLEVTEDELWLIKIALNGHKYDLNRQIREQMEKALKATCKEEKERAQRIKKSLEKEKELTQNLRERLKNREA